MDLSKIKYPLNPMDFRPEWTVTLTTIQLITFQKLMSMAAAAIEGAGNPQVVKHFNNFLSFIQELPGYAEVGEEIGVSLLNEKERENLEEQFHEAKKRNIREKWNMLDKYGSLFIPVKDIPLWKEVFPNIVFSFSTSDKETYDPEIHTNLESVHITKIGRA